MEDAMPPTNGRWWLTTDRRQATIQAPAEEVYDLVALRLRAGRGRHPGDRVLRRAMDPHLGPDRRRADQPVQGTGRGHGADPRSTEGRRRVTHRAWTSDVIAEPDGAVDPLAAGDGEVFWFAGGRTTQKRRPTPTTRAG